MVPIVLFTVSSTVKCGWLKSLVNNLFHSNEFAFTFQDLNSQSLLKLSCVDILVSRYGGE